MSSSAVSTRPSDSGAKPVARAALVTHGRQEQIGDGIARLLEVAGSAGVELIFGPEEAARHGVEASGDPGDADLVVVLGGDATLLRALRTYLGSGIPVIGVNFGRVGFLSSMQPEELEVGLTRAFRGELEGVALRVSSGGWCCRRSRWRTARPGTSPSTTSSSRRRCSGAWSSSSGPS